MAGTTTDGTDLDCMNPNTNFPAQPSANRHAYNRKIFPFSLPPPSLLPPHSMGRIYIYVSIPRQAVLSETMNRTEQFVIIPACWAGMAD